MVKCYCETLQRKGHLSVASFSKSLLRGRNVQPGVTDWVHQKFLHCSVKHGLFTLGVHLQEPAERSPCSLLLTWTGLAHHWSMDCARDCAWRATTWLALLSPQSGVAPASCSHRISPLASCISISLLLPWMVLHLCCHKRAQRRIL